MSAAFLVTLGIGCTKKEAEVDTGQTAVAITSTPALTPPTDPGLDDEPERDPAKNLDYLRKLDGHWTDSISVAIHCDSGCAGNDSVRIKIFVHELTWKIEAA